MAIGNQPALPPGASSEGVGRGRCARVLFNLADRPRKKLITKLNIFFVFTPYPTYNAPKMMASHFPHSSCSSNIPSMLPSVTIPCFWLVVVFWFADWRPINATMYCIFYNFCVAPFDVPNNGTVFPHALHPSRATSPDSLPPQMLTIGWLMCFPFMFRPLKAKTMPITLSKQR